MMADSKYTPGPWHLAKRIARNDSRLFAHLNADVSDAAVIIGASDPDEEAANARLIAAAPMLIEALKEADQDFSREGFDEESPYRKHIRAAIKAAEGK